MQPRQLHKALVLSITDRRSQSVIPGTTHTRNAYMLPERCPEGSGWCTSCWQMFPCRPATGKHGMPRYVQPHTTCHCTADTEPIIVLHEAAHLGPTARRHQDLPSSTVHPQPTEWLWPRFEGTGNPCQQLGSSLRPTARLQLQHNLHPACSRWIRTLNNVVRATCSSLAAWHMDWVGVLRNVTRNSKLLTLPGVKSSSAQVSISGA
jgi:hypothetical protein